MNEYYDGLSVEKKHSYIKTILGHDIVRVAFTKVDGSKREMFCTLQNEFIPDHKQYYSDEEGSPRSKQSESTVSAFDLEKTDWRSFRIDSVEDFGVIREEDLQFTYEKSEWDELPF
jgi:hypothetical protein